MTWKLHPADAARIIDVNLMGAWLVTHHALPHMREQRWGRIIYLGSVVGDVGIPGTSAYAASKAGLCGLTRAVASEVASINVTVNNVALGYIEMDGQRPGMYDRLTDKVKSMCLGRVAARRPGSVSDVIKAIDFIIDSDYVTVQSIRIDGGMV